MIEAGSPSPIDLPNARVPFDYIVTGGQPTLDQLKRASEAGFKTVINLRTDAEQPSPGQESSWVKELGMGYIHIPVAGAKRDNLEKYKSVSIDTIKSRRLSLNRSLQQREIPTGFTCKIVCILKMV